MENTNTTLRIAQTTGVDMFHPEMGETRAADAVIDARLGHYGNHYFLTTRLELKGRGITFLGTDTVADLAPSAAHKAGQHRYNVTIAAYEKIASQHKISLELLLD